MKPHNSPDVTERSESPNSDSVQRVVKCDHEKKTRYAHFEKMPTASETWKPLGTPGNLTAIRTQCDKCGEQWFDYPQALNDRTEPLPPTATVDDTKNV